MNESFKKYVNGIVYGITGIILSIILIRILLLLLSANTKSQFVIFWNNDLSAPLVALFQGMYGNIGSFEIASLVALLFYMIVSFLVAKLLTSFFENDPIQIVSSLIDSIFKVIEFILISRFLLKLFAASTLSPFVRIIYFDLSPIVYEPFRDILPAIAITGTKAVFETSTLIAIIVIVIFDSVTEGIINYLKKNETDGGGSSSSGGGGSSESSTVVQMPSYQQPSGQSHNITINIPHQQAYAPQPPQVIDRRTVQVIQPNPPQMFAYPGFGQNDLEQQRPMPRQNVNPNQVQGNKQPFYQRQAPRNPYL